MRRRGVATHSVAMAAASRTENSAIHGLRRPRPSAKAPRKGLPTATRMPATAAP